MSAPRRRTTFGAVALLLASGCGLPRDPDGTSARVHGGVLRVGLVAVPPQTPDGTVRDAEVALVGELAAELGARVAWTPGSAERVLDELRHRRLDLVVGGLTDDSPWAERVAFTRPYGHARDRGRTRAHVLATAPGENRWALCVDRFLWTHRAEAARRLVAAVGP